MASYFDHKELKPLARLTTPKKIQDFLNTIPTNFEPRGATCRSPRRVLREWSAHCFEGAMLAAAALRLHGHPPLVIDLKSRKPDYYHVLAVFKKNGHWGALSKTNHAVLRYREPVYRTIRELAMSYFHEYFLDNGKKTLIGYSRPINLARFDKLYWMISEEDLWSIDATLDRAPHFKILTSNMNRELRKADPIEIYTGKLTEWSERGKKRVWYN